VLPENDETEAGGGAADCAAWTSPRLDGAGIRAPAAWAVASGTGDTPTPCASRCRTSDMPESDDFSPATAGADFGGGTRSSAGGVSANRVADFDDAVEARSLSGSAEACDCQAISAPSGNRD
jgi:hypothetical protein